MHKFDVKLSLFFKNGLCSKEMPLFKFQTMVFVFHKTLTKFKHNGPENLMDGNIKMVNCMKNKLKPNCNPENLPELQQDECVGFEALLGNDITLMLKYLNVNDKKPDRLTGYESGPCRDEHEHAFI